MIIFLQVIENGSPSAGGSFAFPGTYNQFHHKTLNNFIKNNYEINNIIPLFGLHLKRPNTDTSDYPNTFSGGGDYAPAMIKIWDLVSRQKDIIQTNQEDPVLKKN